MNLLVPAALAFAVIIPIILLLYFMRPKRQERIVGSTLLWRLALQDVQASRPWQRLRITPLLLLQLLAAVVIVLILARPAIFARSAISGNTIIILQSSASMQATDVTPNRFEHAKSMVSDMIDELGPGDHLSLISMARLPLVLATSSQDRAFLHRVLDNAKATNQDADLPQALTLASSLTAAQSDPQVLVVGDGHVMPLNSTLVEPFPVRYMSVGSDAPNVALMALASRSLQGQLTAFAQVANFSSQRRTLPVELYGDGKLIGVQTVTLPANSSSSVEWTPINPTTQSLHAHLLSHDALATDDDAWAMVGSSLHGRVLLVTKGNTYLETALRLQRNVNLFEITPDKYPVQESYDLTIFDNFAPATLPDGNIFFINPPNGKYLFGTSGDLVSVTHIGPGNDTLHLLANVSLNDVRAIHSSHQLQPAVWAQPVIVAPETPLLLAGETDNRRVAALSFDLHESDLPLAPTFPVLVHNLTNWLLPPPVPDNALISPGTPLTIQSWPGAEKVSITDPHQQTTVVAPPFPVDPYPKTDTPGIYQVTQHVHGRDLNGAFSINLFNAGQSKLAPARQLPILHSSNGAGGGSDVPRQLREIWPWVAAFLLLVLCFEWWLFSRNYLAQPLALQRKGNNRNSRTLSNTPFPSSRSASGAISLLPARLQQQLQDRYLKLKRRARKATQRAIGKRRQTVKGTRRDNI